MHEVSIAQGMLDIALGYCEKNAHTVIKSITVKIGKAAGVVPDSLQFAFETLKTGTIAEHALLIIDEIPVTGTCNDCGKHFTVDEAYVIQCPLCGGLSLKVETGRELNIAEMEVE